MRVQDVDQDTRTKMVKLSRAGSPHYSFILKRLHDPNSTLSEIKKLVNAAMKEL